MAVKVINLFHVLFVSPLLLYIGWQASNGIAVDQNYAMLLMGLGLVVMAYHGYRLMQ